MPDDMRSINEEPDLQDKAAFQEPERSPISPEIEMPDTPSVHDILTSLNVANHLNRRGLKEEELEPLMYLSLEALDVAFEQARRVEVLSKPKAHLEKTGTLKAYESAVSRLSRKEVGDPFATGDPYHHFSMLTKNDEWRGRTVKYIAKAALNRLATDTVLQRLPGFYMAMGHHLVEMGQLRAARKYAEKAKQLFAEHYRDEDAGTLLGLDSWTLSEDEEADRPRLDVHFFLELGRASRYLNETPPDIHAIRARARQKPAASSEQKKRSKSQVSDDLPLFSGPLVSRVCSLFGCHHSAA